MLEQEFSERLTKLRLKKGVSARDMSLTLGQSESYINRIESQKMLPSMSVFFYICDYFGITPEEFFATEETPDLEIPGQRKTGSHPCCDPRFMMQKRIRRNFPVDNFLKPRYDKQNYFDSERILTMLKTSLFAASFSFYYFPGYYYSADFFACCGHASPNPR